MSSRSSASPRESMPWCAKTRVLAGNLPICRRNRILAPHKLGGSRAGSASRQRWPRTFEPLLWPTAVWTANVRSEVTHHLYEELVAEGAPAFLTFDRAAAALLPCLRRRTGASQAARSPSASRTVARESSTCESQPPSSLSKSRARGSPGRCLRPGGRASAGEPATPERLTNRDYRYFEKPAGIVTASGTLTLREAAYEEPIQGETGRWRHL
jgi:hypothetical protein